MVFVLAYLSGYSQQTETYSMLRTPNKYLQYDASVIQLSEHLDLNSGILSDGAYDLGFITKGLYLRPENINLDSPFLRAYGNGFNFKYYLGKSDFYLLAGPQAIIFDTPEFQKQRTYNIGINMGVGYDINSNTQIEGKLYQSLDKNYDQNAFQPVQMVPLQPISLGFKTKF